MLQEVQGVSAAELLVGGAGRDALFGVPRRQRARRTRAVARPAREPAPSSGQREDSLVAFGHGGLSGRAAALLRRGKRPALWRDRVRDRRRRDRGFPRGCADDAGERMEAADPQNGRPAAAHRSRMGRGRLRAQLGRTQPQPRRLPLSRDPREAHANWRWATRRSCRFQRRPLARRGFTNSLAS